MSSFCHALRSLNSRRRLIWPLAACLFTASPFPNGLVETQVTPGTATDASEIRWKGRTVSQWLKDWQEGRPDFTIFREIGDDRIVSEAVEIARDPNRPLPLRHAAISVFTHLRAEAKAVVPALKQILQGPHSELQGRALFALLTIDAEQVKEVTPVMLRMLREGDPQADWFWANWGHLSDPTLIQGAGVLLLDRSRSTRQRLFILTKLDGASKPSNRAAFDELLGLLIRLRDDPDAVVRRYADFVLWHFDGKSAEEVIPSLVFLLEHPEPGIRVEAGIALSKMGMKRESNAAAAKSVPALIKALETDADGSVRMMAAFALQRIGPSAMNAVPALIRAAQNRDHPSAGYEIQYRRENPGVRHDAVSALGTILEDPARPRQAYSTVNKGAVVDRRVGLDSAVGLLSRTLKDPMEETGLRQKAAWSLGSIRPNDEQVASIMASTLRDNDADPKLRQAVAGSLVRLGAQTPTATSAFLEALRSDAPDLVTSVLRSLRRYPAIEPFASDILKLARHEDEWISAEATTLLGRLAAGKPELVAVLLGQLARQDPFVLANAAEAIASLKPDPVETVPVLIEALKRTRSGSTGDVVPLELARALGSFKTNATAAVPVLKETLKLSQSPPVREAALDALMGIVRLENERGEILLSALRDDSDWVRREALNFFTMRLARTIAHELVPEIERFLNNPRVAGNSELPGMLSLVEKLGPAAEPLLPLLEDLRRKETDAGRRAALDSRISSIKAPDQE